VKQFWRRLLVCGTTLAVLGCGSVSPQFQPAAVAQTTLNPKADPQAVAALSYVLMDAETGRVLTSHNMHQRRAPASTTKTMTALLAVEKGDLNAQYTIGPNPPQVGESSIALQKGEQLTLFELVEAAMIRSANDSCVAIAEAVAGTEADFVKMMNQRAKQLGANNTHFVNPHGLNDPEHYTTAYDLALIAREAMKHDIFRQIVKTKETTIRGNAKVGAVRQLHNRNRLLFRWDEADGIKTGYTRQAGRCLIASATRIDPATNRPWQLIGVVLNSPDTWNDSANLLIRHGFEKFKPTLVVRGGQELARIPIENGASEAVAEAKHEIRLPLRPWELSALTKHVHPLERTAPIKEKQTIAWLEWQLNGNKIASVPLVAKEAVPESFLAKYAPWLGTNMPSKPIGRWSVYALGVVGLLLLTGWKVKDNNERKRKRQARQRARRQQQYDRY
jgi:D-alanyl-D-alanine carboxypeptidase (penicillin-binding protein 5/6)